MCLKVQEERRSGTRFNEKRNITNSSFERNMKSAADSIQSPNRFELLNCETTENDGDDHPYHKDNFIVGINTINYHSRYKPSKRPEIVTNRFPENQRIFQKKCTVSGEKTYKETVTKKTNTAFTNNVAILADSIISFNRGIKPEFNKTLRTGRARFKHFPVIYRPPDYSNLLAFFKELGKYLNMASENYDNFIVMGDFNIDIRQTSPESHKLD